MSDETTFPKISFITPSYNQEKHLEKIIHREKASCGQLITCRVRPVADDASFSEGTA